ncbi:Hypothetical_protein [Hexamita inflata]|uniref:Hypothetical_protein n=1 Tax=Hexamita inflata TaxID=28002 RepID=A0AA86TNZ8_9EUKA|nr:Hypothetical protein HINF_LOCUS11894 [Hexamita inflata]
MWLNKQQLPKLQLYTIPEGYNDSEIIKSMHELADFNDKPTVQSLFQEYLQVRKSMRQPSLDIAVQYHQVLSQIITIIQDLEKEYIFLIPWQYGKDQVQLHSLTEECILSAMNVAAISNSVEQRLAYYNTAISMCEKSKSDMKPIDDLRFLSELTKAICAENMLIDALIEKYSPQVQFTLSPPDFVDFHSQFSVELSNFCEQADSVGRFYKKAMKYKDYVNYLIKEELVTSTNKKFYFYRRFSTFLLIFQVYKEQPTVAFHVMDEIERYYASHNLELDQFYVEAKLQISQYILKNQNRGRVLNEQFKSYTVMSFPQNLHILQKGFDSLAGNLLVSFNDFTSNKRYEYGIILKRLSQVVQQISCACTLQAFQQKYQQAQLLNSLNYQQMYEITLEKAKSFKEQLISTKNAFAVTKRFFKNDAEIEQISILITQIEQLQLGQIKFDVICGVVDKAPLFTQKEQSLKTQHLDKQEINKQNQHYLSTRQTELDNFALNFNTDEELKQYILKYDIQVQTELNINENFDKMKKFVENKLEKKEVILNKIVELENYLEIIVEQNIQLFKEHFGVYEFQFEDIITQLQSMQSDLTTCNNSISKMQLKLKENQMTLQQYI